MFRYYMSLSGFERFLLISGILSLAIAVINIVIGILEMIDIGIRKRKSGATAVLLTTGAVCLFSFLTLFMITKGISWYMAYPISVLALLIYGIVSAIFLGISQKLYPRKIRFPKLDKKVAIGHIGLVYKTVFPDDPSGCVSVDIFGSTIESYAISATGDELQVGTIVQIIDIDDDILVCSVEKNENSEKNKRR